MKFAKFLRTPIWKNICEQLLLEKQATICYLRIGELISSPPILLERFPSCPAQSNCVIHFFILKMRKKIVLAIISANFWVNNQDKALDLVETGMGSSWIFEFLFKFTTGRSNIRSKKNKTDLHH